MKALLYLSVHGLLIIEENDKLFQILWKDRNLEELAQKYIKIQRNEIPDELKIALHDLRDKGYDGVYVENPHTAQAINSTQVLQAITFEDINRLKEIQSNLINYWMEGKVNFSAKDIRKRSKTLAEILIKAEIAETATQKDIQVKQASDSIVDIDKSINFFITRLREWYGLHFPELTDKLITDNKQFAEFVARIGSRSNITPEILQNQLHFSENKSKLIQEKARRSMGGLLDESDTSTIRKLAQQIIELYEYRDYLESYISDTLDQVAPNLKSVIGANITAKLISIAGSLERLAKMSSSTVQMLGAEKALFKALKSGGDTPKYGVIFQWNKIRREKTYLRGKIARMVAGKLSILAKVDFYGDRFIGDEINREIDDKIEHLKKQFPRPPKKKHHSKSHYSKRNQPHHSKKSRSYRKKHR